VPDQIRHGHFHLLVQELSPRPQIAAIALRAAAKQDVDEALVGALANHRDFVTLLSAMHQLDPEAAVNSARVAAKLASDHKLLELCDSLRRSAPPPVVEAAVDVASSRGITDQRSRRLTKNLTRREQQVLALMADGLGNADIAARLFVTIATVKTHVNHIFTKLGVTSRVEAVLAYQRDLTPSP
jgi:DNA-binding NarL/FixJ family response regulator